MGLPRTGGDFRGRRITDTHDTTLTYTANKAVGTAKVAVKFKGNYSDTKNLTFTINPTKTTIASASNVKGKKMKVVWKKNTVGSGYEVQYSTDKTFKKGVKTVKISKNGTVSTTIAKLTKGKTYYARVRTVKTVSKVNYYSGWSAVKSAKISK